MYKNYTRFFCAPPGRINKYFLIMKLTVVLLIAGLLQVSAATLAQKVTFVHKQTSFEQIIRELRKQTNYNVLVSANKIKNIKRKDVDFKNATITEVLETFLKDQPLSFEIQGELILIKEKQETVITDPVQAAITVTGTVKDEKGLPLPGVNIKIKGTSTGVASNQAGEFSITVPNAETILVFTFIGYQTVEFVAGNVPANLMLKPEIMDLTSVVVVGYGTQKKINLTGAVDQVTSKVLENRSLPNLASGLQGVLPNLNLVPRDGKPIQAPGYNVRGSTSIGQGGIALVLIDGVEGDPSRINPNDVATVTLLKDAASAAIYGARAAFGVVLITTKSPSKDKIIINYSYDQSIKSPTRLPQLVTNGYQFASLFNQAYTNWYGSGQTAQNVNKTIKFSAAYLAEFAKRDADPSLPKTDVNSAGEYVYYENTDWLKLLYKDHNGARDHNLSVSGSNGKADFLLTGRLYKQDGLFRYNSDDYSMANFRAKGSIQVYPWLKIYNNADYSAMKYHNPLNVGEGGGIWVNMEAEAHTMAPLYNPDGTLTYSAAYTVGDFVYGKNGIDMDKSVFRNTAGFDARFIDDQFRVKGDFTFQNTNNNQFTKRVPVPYSRIPGVIEYVGSNLNDITQSFQPIQYLVSNIYSEFEPKWSEVHHFKVLAGFNYEQSTLQTTTTQRNGLAYPDANNINLALGQSIVTSGGYDKWAVVGGFYRLNYDYKGRYLVEANGRYDGSSKFPDNQRYAFFPSVSAGWRVSSEPFWQVSPSLITDLKIRGSYGSLGNGSIGSYAFQEQFGISQLGRILNGVRPQTTSAPGVLPDGLTWETSRSQNLGVDMSMLGGKLSVSADAYTRKTINMFTVGLTLPAVFGTGAPKGNNADMKTSGWEVSVGWRDRLIAAGSLLTYGFRATLSDYNSMITKYNNADKRLADYYEGQQIGEIWGYQNAGYFTSAQDIANSPKQILVKASNTGTLAPGDIKYADLNGDGIIDAGNNTVGNPGDRRIIGNALPHYTYGFSTDVDWKNFFFSAFIQGVGKRDWYPGPTSGYFWGQYASPYFKATTNQLDNMWSPENPDAYFPRFAGYKAAGTNELANNQTKYLQNAAYIRLKNIQLGYHLPVKLIQKIGLKDTRVFISGENLWTWSPMFKYTKNFDPESIDGSDRVVSDGTTGNGNNYPMLKTITIGISATF
jgi:TonB-linked SusC/RagA family outer membrane protein